ncbi:hypothetical protein ACQP25_18090 [Microtetraspora malaysiensis]|uniref:hypothetical protein n=1 Tax=Microtetraspora malaysiensis TaxID=161358 RepID=UPI003D912728
MANGAGKWNLNGRSGKRSVSRSAEGTFGGKQRKIRTLTPKLGLTRKKNWK